MKTEAETTARQSYNQTQICTSNEKILNGKKLRTNINAYRKETKQANRQYATSALTKNVDIYEK